jgi:hypothetical protein
VLGGEELEAIGIVSDDHASTESDGGGDDERVDSHLASRSSSTEQVPGNTSHPGAGGHNLGKPPGQDPVDDLVDTATPIQLDEDRRGNPDRDVPGVGTAHGGSHSLVSKLVLMGAGESGDRLTAKD